MSLFFLNPSLPSNSIHPIPRRAAGIPTTRCSISAPEKKPRRRRKQIQKRENEDSSSFGSSEAVSALERSLRLTFMDELMERARNRDPSGVSEVIYDMIAAGLTPGPRSFHGLVVAHALNGDEQGAVKKRFSSIVQFLKCRLYNLFKNRIGFTLCCIELELMVLRLKKISFRRPSNQ